MTFDELNIIEPIRKAIREEGYTVPTLIQEQGVPLILSARDLVGCAQTGTGKTAAFAIPILQLLNEDTHVARTQKIIRSLIITPTRELAIQIGESFTAYGRYLKIRHAVVFGGVSQLAQTNALHAGVDILIATPGRLLDLVGQGYINLHHIKIFVIDEADRMLDMGFSHDVKKIIHLLPDVRQTLLFSATMPPEITALVDSILIDPVKIAVTPVSSTVDTIEQTVYYVDKKSKKDLLIHLLKTEKIDSALVFTRTKHGADKTTRDLNKSGIHAEAIHGNKSQTARQLALNNFKTRRTRVLVATDIAARGLDVEELSHVINYDIPNIPETYVHRIGRTGRAGLGGIAISLCDSEERPYLKDIQKLISKTIPLVKEHPYTASVESSEISARNVSAHEYTRKDLSAKPLRKSYFRRDRRTN